MSTDKLLWAITSEPFVELTLQAVKSRRSLLLCCLLAWGRMYGVAIDGSMTVMEARVEGLTPERIDWLLFGGLTYFALMLTIHGFESLQKWKLRLTGVTWHQYIAAIGYINQQTYEPTQGVAYKIFKSLANRMEKQLVQIEDQRELRDALNGLTGSLNNFKREMDENGDKLTLLEKKFWRHQLTLVLRFSLLDYFGPLLAGSLTAGFFLHYIITTYK